MNDIIGENSFDVYKSSAGSGKTHTLVNVFLKLLFSSSSDYSFKTILAITFTNKAAEEMKFRIISTLEELSVGKKQEVLNYLNKELKLDSSQIIKRSEFILGKIIHNYSDLNILTIDRFTHKIIKSFSKELGLSFQYDIDLEEEDFLEDCIVSLLDLIGEDKVLTKYLNDMVDESVRKSENFNLERQLNMFKNLLFKSDRDERLDVLEKLNIEEFSHLRTSLIKQFKDSINAIQEISKKGKDLIIESGLSAKAFSRNRFPLIFNVFNENGNIEFKFFEKITKWVDEEKWFNKAYLNDSSALKYGPKLSEIASNLVIGIGEYFKYHEMNKHFTAFSLVFILMEKIEQTKQDKGVVLISDFNQLISKIIENEPAGFIYERLGSKFSHVLIDEFQDTSTKQWNNLLPLVHESLSSGGKNLIVGDAKQAIYRWRDGDVQQFVNLPKIDSSKHEFASLLDQHHIPHKLDDNYRSAKSIVNFNSELFLDISKQFDHSSISKIYKDVKQNVIKKNIGRVEFNVIDKKQFDLKRYLNKKIELLIEKGFYYSDINVLVRVKKEGMLVAEVFKELDIPFVSDDSVFLSSSLEFKFLFHFIKFLEIQNDHSKLFILKRLESDSKFKHKAFDWNSIYMNINDFSLNDLLFHLQEIDLNYYFSLPVMGKINYVIQKLKIDIVDPYIDKLLELTWDFFYLNPCTMHDILEMWKEKEEKISVDTGNQDAVRIITIHKSKGLEFPIVIMPFGSWSNSKSNNANYTWLNNIIANDLGISNFISPMTRTSLTKLQSIEIFKKEQELLFLDNINLYYVGFTRAVEQLYVCLNPTTKLNNISDYVHNFVVNHNFYDINQNQLIIGEFESKINSEQKSSNDKVVEFIDSPLANSLPFILPKGFYKNDKILYGDFFHLIMEKIYTDFQPGFELNEELYLSNHISKEHFDEFNCVLNLISNNPELDFLFDSNSTIYNEREINLSDNSKYIIDKLIIDKKGNVFVLDYKTGNEDSKNIDQVKKYIKALKIAGYLNCKGYLLYIPSVKLIKV